MELRQVEDEAPKTPTEKGKGSVCVSTARARSSVSGRGWFPSKGKLALSGGLGLKSLLIVSPGGANGA